MNERKSLEAKYFHSERSELESMYRLIDIDEGGSMWQVVQVIDPVKNQFYEVSDFYGIKKSAQQKRRRIIDREMQRFYGW